MPDTPSPIDEYFEVVYDELRRMAHRLKAGDRGSTLTPTALVHEAYLQLSKSFRPESPEHLKYTVVRAMRRILIDAARHRTTARRGGGAAPVSITDSLDMPSIEPSINPARLLEIDTALGRLERAYPVRAQVFECHFYGGLPQSEIARVAGISEKSTAQELKLAKVFLSEQLNGAAHV